MIFMLPSEFMAPDDDCEEQDLEEAMAQLNLEPIPATFEKQKMKNVNISKLCS